MLLNRRRLYFVNNYDDHLMGEEALRTSVVKLQEVVEDENASVAKIAGVAVESVDIPCLPITMPGLVKIVIYVQERIT